LSDPLQAKSSSAYQAFQWTEGVDMEALN